MSRKGRPVQREEHGGVGADDEEAIGLGHQADTPEESLFVAFGGGASAEDEGADEKPREKDADRQGRYPRQDRRRIGQRIGRRGLQGDQRQQ